MGIDLTVKTESGIPLKHCFMGTKSAKSVISSFKGPIIVYFDPDVDGMIAGYLVCRYLKILGRDFTTVVNQNRSHDWSLDFGTLLGKNVIAVDFQITRDTLKSIVDAGCNILSMDHHINDKEFIAYESKGKQGYIINNQYPFEPEDGRYLSGAGVVFEVLSTIEPKMDTVENRALVGLTLLSDVCDIENKNAKLYLDALYSHKYEGYIKYLIQGVSDEDNYKFGVPRFDRNFVDFRFSPVVNSNLRFNRGDEVVRFFLRQGELDKSCQQRQKTLVNEILSKADVVELSHLRVCCFKSWDCDSDYPDNVYSNFVGLIASRLLDGKKSVLCFSITGNKDDKESMKIGRVSFRGALNKCDYISQVSRVAECAGHDAAFGLLNFIPSREMFESINKACIEVEGGATKTLNIVPVSNMSLFNAREALGIAKHNEYCLSRNKKYIRYTGNKTSKRRSGEKFVEWGCDGVKVMSFDPNLTFENGLIVPVLDRGYVCYYLTSDRG